MSEHLLYPTEWPGHCIARLIDIGPDGLFDRKDEVIKSALTILSFFAGKVLGDPDAKPVIGELSPEDQEKMVSDLDSFLQVFGKEDDKVAVQGLVTGLLVDRLLAIIIPILLKWLEEWLTKNKEGE